jgi:hypothetical protein
MSKTATKTNRVRERFYLLYDFDLPERQTLLQIYLTIEEDGVRVGTPKPPLYEARLGKEKPIEIPKREGLKPREFDCCFRSLKDPNKAETRGVYNPYRPSTNEWKGLATELINYPDVLAVEYTGESHSSDYEDFIS